MIEVTVTPEWLYELAKCSQRMTCYADPDDSLLITIMRSQQGEPVRLVLDKQCVCGSTKEVKTRPIDSS